VVEEQEQRGASRRSNGRGTDGGGEAGAARVKRQEQRKGTDARFIGPASPKAQARDIRTGRTPMSYHFRFYINYINKNLFDG
jgi:hypothetical protein